MIAFFLSHNGLGDNITNIGAVNFLLNYYDKIYFLCKDKNEENVKLFFINKNVITVPFDSNNEFQECYNIIKNIQTNTTFDCFISGCHTTYVKSRITNVELLNYKKNNKYNIKYEHINNFYNDIGLDNSVYIDYFKFDISKELNICEIKEKIIFLHTQGSNRQIDVTDIINKYINNDDYIIICANKNVYSEDNIKFSTADKYVNIKVAYYIDIIKHADEIHVIDSCFSCIIFPLIISKQIKNCIIYDM